MRQIGATSECALSFERRWDELSRWFRGGSFPPGHTAKSSSSPEKKTLYATQRDTERVQQLRVEYWHEIGEVKLADERVCR